MKSNPWCLKRVVLTAAVLIPTASFAQTESLPPDCAADAECYSLSENAKQQSSSGNLSEALRMYQAAYERLADPRLLFNIARIYHKQKQYAEALTYYQQYLDSSLSANEQKRKASEYLAQCQAERTEQSKPSQIPILEQPSEVEPPPSDVARPRPIYTKWWFWLGIGGFAAAGVTTGVLLGTRPTDTIMVRERMMPTNTLMFSF